MTINFLRYDFAIIIFRNRRGNIGGFILEKTKKKTQLNTTKMTAKFEERAIVNGSFNTIFEKCVEAIQHCKFEIVSISERYGLITAKAGFSFWSWGETITVSLSRSGEILVKSECVLPTQVISWGKNEANVNKIFAQLERT